jgi:hypothetical protein
MIAILLSLILVAVLLGSSGVGIVIITSLLVMAPWDVKIIMILGLLPFFLVVGWIFYNDFKVLRG